MAKYTDRHDIDDTLHLYKQANSKRWYARFKLDEWYSKATKESSLERAIHRAIEIRTEYRFAISNNVPIHKSRKTTKHKFKTIADCAKTRMQDAIDNGTGRVIFADYIGAINKYLIPYFEKMHIKEVIEAETLLDFDTWRIKTLKRNPAKSTILTHNTAMQRVLDEAVIRKVITASELPVLANNGEMGKSRAAFTKEEYRQILEKSESWISEGAKQVTRDIRAKLHFYIQLAALTGMRIGTEMDNLIWSNIQIIQEDNMPYMTITVQKGKTTKYTGTREIVVKRELMLIVQDALLKFRKGYDDKIFSNTGEYGNNFNKILESLNLKTNAHGVRTLYSLRHSYITWSLKDGIKTSIIATQCGTSEQMIEQHYKHTNPTMFAKELS